MGSRDELLDGGVVKVDAAGRRWYTISTGSHVLLPLFRAATIAIVRHVKIHRAANPYDSVWTYYFNKRRLSTLSAVEPGLQQAAQWLEPYAA